MAKEINEKDLEQVSGGEFVSGMFYAKTTGIKNRKVIEKRTGPYDSAEEALAVAKEVAISYYNNGFSNIVYHSESCNHGDLLPGELHNYPEV